MKLAIVGSRDFNDYQLMSEFILSKFDLPDIDTIVSGGAKGADALAERFAQEYKLALIVKDAEWEKYGRAAGPIRNKLIIEEVDAVVAFPSIQSKGTLNSIKFARKMCRKVEILSV